MSFRNKVMIVTGGSSGIGAAVCLHFAKESASVVIVGRNEKKLQEVANKCSQFEKQPLIIKADISKDAEAKQIIDQTVKTFGKIDVLVNNAGISGEAAKIQDQNLMSVYDNVMNTNLRPVFLLCNLAVPHLIKTKGNIVNVSSVAGLRGFPCWSTYATSKAALTHFGTIAAVELAEVGVRVNTVSPGPTETDMTSNTSEDALKAITAQKRISQPWEIAEVVAFVANKKSLSITGSNYIIDCGYMSVKEAMF